MPLRFQLQRLCTQALQLLALLGQQLHRGLLLSVEAGGGELLNQRLQRGLGLCHLSFKATGILGAAAGQCSLCAHGVDLGQCAPLCGLIQSL